MSSNSYFAPINERRPSSSSSSDRSDNEHNTPRGAWTPFGNNTTPHYRPKVNRIHTFTIGERTWGGEESSHLHEHEEKPSEPGTPGPNIRGRCEGGCTSRGGWCPFNHDENDLRHAHDANIHRRQVYDSRPFVNRFRSTSQLGAEPGVDPIRLGRLLERVEDKHPDGNSQKEHYHS
ncbi:MAG: hypothetical protein M1834_007246 [Cirrosporium novae-zelandiae]|nr:MAG: hypothetical protein M1834_007246 [Cirrosporium novae-zelandiae]